MTPEPPPLPTPQPTSSFYTHLGVILTGVILITIPLALGLIWVALPANPNTPIDRFVPSASGTTLVYQMALPDGTAQYRSATIGRGFGSDAFGQLELTVREEIISRVMESKEPTAEQQSAFLTNHTHEVRVARLIETTHTSTATLRADTSVFWLDSDHIELMTSNGQAFIPFVPFYDTALTVGESRSVEGTFGAFYPYSATLTFEAEEAVETPLEVFEQCQRFLLVVDIPDLSYTHLRSWFCEGVGVAVQEAIYERGGDPTRSLLIAAHTPAVSSSAALPPLLPAPTPAPPVDTPPIGTEWETIWSYHDGLRQRGDISTPFVVAGNLYLVGDEEGQLTALDRTTHLPAWRFYTGNALYAAPVVAAGMVYVPGSDGVLYALDVQNGTFRWAFRTRDLLSAAPTVANGVLYLGAEDRTLYALDAATGAEQWRYNTGGPIASAPAVANGVVYIGSDDGGLYALDAATGEPRWIFPADAGIEAGVVVADGMVVAGTVDRWVYALNTDTSLAEGEVVWSFEAEDSIQSDLVIADGTLYVTAAETLYALDIATGAERWRFNTRLTLYGPPLPLDGALFINMGRFVAMLDVATGEEVSRIPTGSPDSYTPLARDGNHLLIGHGDGFMRVMSSRPMHPWRGEVAWIATRAANSLRENLDFYGSPPVTYQEHLLYVSGFGRVYQINREDGNSQRLGNTGLSLAYLPPIVVQDTLIAGTFMGQLTAFNLTTNEVQWEIDLGAPTYTPVYADGNRLLWAATIGNEVVAYAFDVETGDTLWQQPLPYAFAATPTTLLYEGVFYTVGDTLNALDPATGEILWQSTEDLRPLYLAADGDTVYAMGVTDDFDTQVVGWNIASRTATVVIPYAAPTLPSLFGGIVSGSGVVVLVGDTGDLTVLDSVTQSLRWQMNIGRGVQGVPLLYNNDLMLYITADHHLHARRLDDGELVGDFALQRLLSPDNTGTMTPVMVDGQLYIAFSQEAFALPLR
jgi:outer membrane protein assembly factor BamB